MGHHIQVIVAPTATAEAISRAWPELPRLDRPKGFAVFPVDADLIDARIKPEETTDDTGCEFSLLTSGFRKFLHVVSRDGELAYVETNYFGGVGGQGALVCRNGDEVMPPTWGDKGVIHRALGLIGMGGGLLMDRFLTAGFGQVRNNEKLLELIAAQRIDRSG